MRKHSLHKLFLAGADRCTRLAPRAQNDPKAAEIH